MIEWISPLAKQKAGGGFPNLMVFRKHGRSKRSNPRNERREQP
jgi:hypothetical protein